MCGLCFFFFNDPATTEIYTLSLHDALPILRRTNGLVVAARAATRARSLIFRERVVEQFSRDGADDLGTADVVLDGEDRKSTRLNSSHANISYAVFCLKKNNSEQSRARSPLL